MHYNTTQIRTALERYDYSECEGNIGATACENLSSAVLTCSDTNWPLQSQEQARSLKFGFKREKCNCTDRNVIAMFQKQFKSGCK